MKVVSLSGSLRESVGKKDARKLRDQGHVPCVIYGGKEQIHFHAAAKDFKPLVFTGDAYFVNINIDGKEYTAVLQDIHFHPVTDNIYHADFLELKEGKEVVLGIPIETTGVSKGVLMGGKLLTKMRKVKVKALVENMPEKFILDITDLKIGDGIRIDEIETKDCEILERPSNVVVAVRVTRIAVEEEEEEEEGIEGEEGVEGEEGATTEAAAE